MSSDKYPPEVVAVSAITAIPTILDVVCRITGMGFAAVARVTEDRWIACSVKDDIAFGLEPGGELKIETTICNEIRNSREPVVIDHLAEDSVWCTHHTPIHYGFQSYISMPIVLTDGTFFGTLCAIDPKPRALNRPEVIGMFKLFSDLIAFHLDTDVRLTNTASRLAASDALLSSERETSALREQFIAVLGHDLRNPIAALDSGLRLIERTSLDDRARSLLPQMRKSLGRMDALVANLLDFARGRLGGGLPLNLGGAVDLRSSLQNVVDELRAGHPDRVIEFDCEIGHAVPADSVRIQQLLSNLLGNALTHGDPATPVRVVARTDKKSFEMSVSNTGKPLSEAAREKLFQPFFREEVRESQQGLGLGLYIASEIAKAHGGTLTADSSPQETRFTFRMPL
jgi:signal transduction histidine kinase